MRVREFLPLANPMIVQQDGREVVLLAFTVGVFGRLGAMVVEPLAPSVPRLVALDRLTFPPAVRVGPAQRVGSATLGNKPVSIDGANRAQRRASRREN